MVHNSSGQNLAVLGPSKSKLRLSEAEQELVDSTLGAIRNNMGRVSNNNASLILPKLDNSF